MKELDELLVAYLERCYPDASQSQKERFESMLELEDPVLANLLLRGGRPADRDESDVIETIRELGRPQP